MPRTVQRKDGDVVWSECPECHKKIDLMEKQWTYDRYEDPKEEGVPDCYDEVQERSTGTSTIFSTLGVLG